MNLNSHLKKHNSIQLKVLELAFGISVLRIHKLFFLPSKIGLVSCYLFRMLCYA